MKDKKALIIGSGIGGLATAIRLSKLGFSVHVFEANDFAGGKINSKTFKNYRFDMGPSIFTEPYLMDELLELSEQKTITFDYSLLSESCRYFFADSHSFTLPVGKKEVSIKIATELGEDKEKVFSYLDRMEKNYTAVAPVFIQVSLHKIKQLLNKQILSALKRLFKYGLSSSMNKVNASYYKNPKTVQLFNRFATYNGSNPYETPGMLNIISHLELNKGPALPKGGMFMITKTLYDIAVQLGVTFSFNEKVERILYSNNRVSGINTIKGDYLSDIVVSNMDVHFTYEKLLKDFPFHPKKILAQEKSSSAVVFYWGIKSEFPDLGLHNIFFSENYKKEFKSIFKTKEMDSDPTIYVNITSKIEKKDAPANSENWFVMVNTPINVGQNWNEIVSVLRKNIIEKLSKVLKTDIESLIEVEEVMDPLKVEALYSGKQGSIYGNASNSRAAAFYRHPNFSKKLKGLYFTGVTVHPGGGIPLALNSAKIVERCVKDDFEL